MHEYNKQYDVKIRRQINSSWRFAALSHTKPPLQIHKKWLSPHWFAWVLIQYFFWLCRFMMSDTSYMLSPLSRSPGSKVLIGMGLPITLASSPFGGAHKLEYCGTPPQSMSPLFLLLLFPVLQTVLVPPPPPLQRPVGWLAAVLPSRGWLEPGAGLACQLVVGVRDWPCAKKRFTSSSPANSARMVVLPSTHLGRKIVGMDSSIK